MIRRTRWILAILMTAVPAVSAQRPAPPRDTLVAEVRTALGHGSLPDAHRILDASASSPASKALAAALIDEFEGKDDAAAARLSPIAGASPLSDAALELALLDLRHGRRDDGRRRLNAISDDLYNRARQAGAPLTDDDYFRLARASLALGKVQLANDAYQRVKGPRPDVQTSWGDMFLSRHNAKLAAESYRVALAADDKWVAAHLGMAKAFGDDDPQVASTEFETARKLAPNHPDMFLVLAQRRIEADDKPGTINALDEAAKVRPGTMDEAMLRVALAFEDRDPAVLTAALKRADSIDPRSARGLRAAGQQAAHGYRFDDAAGLAKQAVERDPEDAAAHSEYGLYLLRTGDEKTARAELEQSWALDTSDPVTKNMLDLLDHIDKYEVVLDGPFIYKFPAADAAVLKVYALPLGQTAYKTFIERYGFTPKGPILVEMFSDHDDFAVRTVGLAGITGALGACFGRVVTMDAPRARTKPDEYSWHATEWHELAHVFTLQLSDYRIPRWLTEGVSVFEEHRREPAWGRELTLEFAAALSRNKTFGVKGLPEAFRNPENYSMAYFEASLVVEHLVSLSGDEGLRRLLKAYADRATDNEAFSRAFGRDIDAVETSYKAFIEQRYGALREAMKEPPKSVDSDDLEGLKARAASAPGNFVSQLAYGQALFRAGDTAGAKAPLERAAQLAPQASGNASPHALLAQIAERAGDNAGARRHLRELLANDHASASAARHLANLAATAKATDDQDFALRRVADLDPYDGNAHTALGQRLLTKSDYAGALVEFQATLALGPTNLAEAHADTAEALLKLGRKDEAKKEAIASLKEAPTYARAQDLLLAAVGKL